MNSIPTIIPMGPRPAAGVLTQADKDAIAASAQASFGTRVDDLDNSGLRATHIYLSLIHI